MQRSQVPPNERLQPAVQPALPPATRPPASFMQRNSSQEPPLDATRLLEQMVALYLKTNPFIAGAHYQTKRVPELEIRFGTGKNQLVRSISKTDYDRVVQALYSAGFKPDQGNDTGIHILRVQSEYYDRRTNMNKISNIRAEIAGVDLIQEYCRTNNLQKLLDLPSTTNAMADKIKFTQKNTATNEGDAGNYIKPVDFPDLGFRASFQMESYYSPRADISRKIIADWTNSKKLFRYLNRVRFAHPDIPIFADISIVKKSKTTHRGVPVPQYTIQESGVLSNPETYEIELELDNQRVGSLTFPELMKHLRNMIRLVLGALQQTRFPIGFAEMRQVLTGYLKLITQDDPETGSEVVTDEYLAGIMDRRDVSVILPRYFVGPSSYTLQNENIVPLEYAQASNIPNIRNHYTVTDKADGERRLLYVASNGRVYMITPSMNVIFTGLLATHATNKSEDMYNTLLDGEFIPYDKTGQPLNLYMAFDIYFVHGKSVRKQGFYPINVEERARGNFRFLYLDTYLQRLKLRAITDTSEMTPTTRFAPTDRTCGFEIQKKNFYVAEGDQIFESCGMILAKIDQGLFPYNTDGLIFTPAIMGVGADRAGAASKPRKETWEHSFKWKPPEYNTIDFLVSVQHDKRGQEDIKYLYEEGRNMQDDAKNIVQYKTLILKCGFDPKKHGYLNPYNDVLHDRLPTNYGDGKSDDDEKYKPVPFQPTDPHDPNACFCYVALRDVGDKKVMMTEENEYFEGDMIVEFRYDMERDGSWKWVPLRVRYDKTGELRAGQKNYGNSYHVANSNWTSIHHPITRSMITTGEGIPTHSYVQNDVYYNRKTKDSNTQALRNFHNLYVKRKLIVGVSNAGDKLIDFACGKGGDLSKWRAAKLKFVLGVDVSRDNIQKQIDGACSRYLSDCRRYGEVNMPRCLFFTGDSGKNIRTTGDAFANPNEREYVKAVFGQGAKNPQELPPGVFKAFGWGEAGFDVGSVQFAIHYFFENETVLHQFLRNVSDCIHVGGYFIGTTYDGQTVFDKLRNKQKGESWTLMKNNTKIAEIVKQYNETEFPSDEHSIGYQINVYQETINQYFPEYLVNFKYLTYLMEQYGFQLVSPEEANHLGLPGSTGMFEELYNKMNYEIRKQYIESSEYGNAAEMSPDEMKISFLNRYFVFKKKHTVNTENLAKIIQSRASIASTQEKVEEEAMVYKTGEVSKTTVIRTKKLKNKLTIACPSSVSETTEPVPETLGEAAPVGKLTKVRVPKKYI